MRIRRIITVLAAAAAISMLSAFPAAAKAVPFDAKGKSDGWNMYNGDWYYVQEDKAVTGWKYIGGCWYFFEDNGRMKSGEWYKDANEDVYYLNEDGSMLTGWFAGNRGWYYFLEDGRMVKNTWYAGYYFSPIGIMYCGQITPDGFWTDPDTGKWDPSGDNKINGYYLWNGEAYMTYDSPAVEQKPSTGYINCIRITRKNMTELDVVWTLNGEEEYSQIDTPVLTYRLVMDPAGKKEPYFENTNYTDWEADRFTFDMDGRLVHYPYYGDVSDQFEYYYSHLQGEEN